MPTKHKRKRNDVDAKDYDLPPSVKAQSLPVIQPTKTFLEPARKKSRPDKPSTKRRKTLDDTPKQFARLMAWHKDGKRLGSGLDNGNDLRKSKQKKPRSKDTTETQSDIPGNASMIGETSTPTVDSESQAPYVNDTVSTQDSQSTLKIKPGETLREFASRVDQALPLSTVSKHNTKHIPGVNIKAPLTKHNKRLARMQADWRATDTKLKTAREEAADEDFERRGEEDLLWDGVRAERAKKKGKKRKGAKAIDDDDPWAKLEKQRRAETKQKDIRDVVQAPPVLKPVKGIFKQDRQPVGDGVVV